MKIYLDNSILNRPFDDLSIGTNRLEAEMLLYIIELIQKKKVALVNSSVIEYENSLNPFPERKAFVKEVLRLAKFYQNLNETIGKRSDVLNQEMRISPIDSLHLASAEHAKVDLFVTSDYNLVKRYQGSLKAILPLDFVDYYENYHH